MMIYYKYGVLTFGARQNCPDLNERLVEKAPYVG